MVWKTLIHNGVLFPPPYKRLPASVVLKYKGQPLTGLTDSQEEALVLYARHSVKPQFMGDKVFMSNFLKDLTKLFRGETIRTMDDLTKHLDVRAVVRYIYKKSLSKQKPPDVEKYKTCVVDGKEQPVSNFRIEPPDLFKGRGAHPLRGRLKARVRPEDVTINISKNAPIPTPSVPGKWGEIVHIHENLWIASWTEVVTGKRKYVFLAQNSTQRQQKDIMKYDMARQLAGTLPKVRATYMKMVLGPEEEKKQLGVAIYMIDHLALRVGNEKGEDEADTVGVTSLKVHNIRVEEDCVFYFNFLGKDSIRYSNRVYFERVVCEALKGFLHGKAPEDYVFDTVRSTDVNEFLHSLLPGLTAKVFRTCNASILFWEQLHQKLPSKLLKMKDSDNKTKMVESLRFYNRATVKVAELCNHHKAATKSQHEQIKKLKSQLKKSVKPKSSKEIRERIKDKQMMKNLNLGTSRNNYIDPRIAVAYFKLLGLPIEKAFTKTLRERFKWAIESTPSDWKYCSDGALKKKS